VEDNGRTKQSDDRNVDKLRNHELYSSTNVIIKEDELGGIFSTHGTETCIENFGRKPQRKYSVLTVSRRIETKLRGRSPQANYTDRDAAACRRS
jgi:hypothetical protein